MMDESIELNESEETQPQLEETSASTIAVQGDLTMNNSAAAMVQAGENVTLSNSGALAVVAGGSISVTDGLSPVAVAGQDLQMTDSAALGVIAGGSVNASQSFIGIVLSDEVNLSENSQVLLGTAQAALFGAAFGAVFALLSWLLRRRK